MSLLSLPAVFMRGGTSRAVMFHARDLPDRAEWDPLFLAAMGSPDPNGRQLNGMGGGISSLSKVCVIAPWTRKDADLDYTFAQVQIREPRVDYRGNCGNMSSAVGPFAMDEGLVRAEGDMATVRIYNTHTKKLIHATFPLRDNLPRYDGDLVIPGVAGSGAPVRLDFIAPGGATTGKLLPTGHPVDTVDVPGVGIWRRRMHRRYIGGRSAGAGRDSRDDGTDHAAIPLNVGALVGRTQQRADRRPPRAPTSIRSSPRSPRPAPHATQRGRSQAPSPRGRRGRSARSRPPARSAPLRAWR